MAKVLALVILALVAYGLHTLVGMSGTDVLHALMATAK
jgi:hypothetical protein